MATIKLTLEYEGGGTTLTSSIRDDVEGLIKIEQLEHMFAKVIENYNRDITEQSIALSKKRVITRAERI